MRTIRLKENRDWPVRNGHFWIFSGAIAAAPAFADGDILGITAANGDFLGYAFCNNRTNIACRMITRTDQSPLTVIKDNLHTAIVKRQRWFNADTNCYRLVNSEADNLSGLIVDRYNDVVVIQISTAGFAKIKDFLITTILEIMAGTIVAIFEKSAGPSRETEGLTSSVALLWGELPTNVIVQENNIKFNVDIREGQKTGLFLDMRDMRCLIEQVSLQRRVLNCFCYSGGFSLYAVRGGATHVHSIDVSAKAIELAKANFVLNNFSTEQHLFTSADVFQYLRSLKDELDYELVILDPPAFAKKRHHLKNAQKGYQELNTLALQKMVPGSLLLTCSCSHFIEQPTFETIIEKSANLAGRKVTLLQRHRLAFDHAINMQHTETEYLKSLLILVE